MPALNLLEREPRMHADSRQPTSELSRSGESVSIHVHLWFLICCYAARPRAIANLAGASFDCLKQLLERLDEQPDAIGQHLTCNLVKTDPDFFKPSQYPALLVEIGFNSPSRPPVIAER